MVHSTPDTQDIIDTAGMVLHHLDAEEVRAALLDTQTDAVSAIRVLLEGKGLTATYQAMEDAADRFNPVSETTLV
jgi:hypothetical protein